MNKIVNYQNYSTCGKESLTFGEICLDYKNHDKRSFSSMFSSLLRILRLANFLAGLHHCS